MNDDVDVRGRAASGAAWAATTQALSKGTTVIATLLLARLLVPDDFGLFAVGMLFVNYLDRIKDLGVGAALLFRPEPWPRLAPTGLTLAIASSGILAALGIVGAPAAAQLFGEPAATDLLRVLSVVLFITGLQIVPESRMRRALDFRTRAIPETATAVIKGVSSVVLAALGFGVWSLVWGQVIGVVISTAMYWTLARWRPRVGWDREIVRPLLVYGLPTSLIAVFAVIQENIDYFVISRRLGAEQLGYYTMAYRIPELTVLGLCLVASMVLFPLLARMQDDREALTRTYLSAVRVISALTVLLGVLLAVLAPETVAVAYGPGWEPTVPALRLLALFMVVYSLGFHAGDVYKATGRPGILNWFAVAKIGLLAPILWILVPHGIAAVAAGMVGTHVLLGIAELVVAGRILHISLREFTRALGPSLVAGLGMALVGVALQVVSQDLPAIVRLLGIGLVMTACYVAAIRLLAPDVYALGRGRVVRLLGRVAARGAR